MENSAPPEKRQANPFALPAETDGRFRMLILIAVILVTSLATPILNPPSLFEAAGDVGPNFRRVVAAAIAAVQQGQKLQMPSPEELDAFRSSEEPARMKKVLAAWMAKIVLSAALTMLFVFLAVIFYFCFPLFYLRHYQVRSLDSRSAPRAVGEVLRLAAAAGLHRPPKVLVKPGLLDGLAFGHRGQQSLALAGDPATIDKVWSDLHRAVALHELGHFVNRDIRKREIARALWLALGITLPLAFLLLLRRSPLPEEILSFVARTFGVVLVAWAMWGGLVRAREFYADWRVVTWGFETALARRLRLKETWLPKRQGFFDFWPPWRVHPSNAERLRKIEDPRALFSASPLLAALTGVLLGLVAGNAGPLAIDVTTTAGVVVGVIAALTRSPQLMLLNLCIFPCGVIAMVVVARWITDALGVQILRAAVFDLEGSSMARWGYFRLAGLAAAFVVGLEAGISLTLAAFFGWQSPAFIGLWLAGMFLLIWIWLIQIRAFGRLWLANCASERGKSFVVRWLRWMAAVQLAIVFLPVLAFRFAAHVRASPRSFMLIEQPDQASSLSFFLSSTFIFLMLAFVGFAFVGASALGATAIWLGSRRSTCPACGEHQCNWRIVGSPNCECGEIWGFWFLRPVAGYKRLGDQGGSP